MCCTKYGLNYMYPIGFGEVDYQIFAFHFSLPLEKGMTLYLKNWLCNVWLQLKLA